MADIRTVKKYALLEQERLEVEARLSRLKDEQDSIRDDVLEYFSRQGIQKLSVEGRTLYLKREVYAAKVDKEMAAELVVKALQEAGFEEFAGRSVSWNSLSAMLREREALGEEPVPPALKAVIELHEKFKVGSRAG
jgi:hypothetical protein